MLLLLCHALPGCLQEIGVQIEEPFGILALEVFCDNICKNIKQAQTAAAPLREAAQGHLATAQVPLPLPLSQAAAGISKVAGHSLTSNVHERSAQVMAAVASVPAALNSSSSSCGCVGLLPSSDPALPIAADKHGCSAGFDEQDLGLYVGSAVAAPDSEEDGFTM
jgi:hypothetical protein